MNLSPFEEFDLSPELLKALEKKGYTRPTAIQLEAIPAAMEERDVLGSAPTCDPLHQKSAFLPHDNQSSLL